MVLSDISIKRPVFATVISLVLTIFGIFSFDRLSVREYPNIDPPIVSVSTNYKGASAYVVETQITQILEDAVSGIEGIKTITSSSREGSSSISIEFRLNRDVDASANDVRDRVSRVLARLPEVADPPVIAKVESDASPILWMSLTSDRMNSLELTDFAKRYLVDRLSTVPGVSAVRIGGERRYAMRIWLDRREMAARELTVKDVEDALKRQNVELPAGRIESREREFTVRTDTGLKTPEQFRNMVVAQRRGYAIKLGEIARVELGAQDSRNEIRNNGQTAIGMGVIKQSTANTLEVANGVKAELEAMKSSFPEGFRIDQSYDQSLFIAQSIYEVFHALSIALLLVVGIIYFFLRSFRATIIPAVAIPVSIVASLTVLAALGFSINILTLLALVLSIGLVVDDAIVVLENIHRRIEEGEPPLLAAYRGAREIGFAVVATTLVLIAVFVPISFLHGNVGRLFTEFGISVAAAVLFSGIVALTLTPMMCSKLLRPVHDEGVVHRLTEPLFVGMNNGYRWLLDRSLNAPLLVIALVLSTALVAAGLFQTLKREFSPIEDRGYFSIRITGPEGASIDNTRRVLVEVEKMLQPMLEAGDVVRVFANLAPSFFRPGDVRTVAMFIRLAPWENRTRPQKDMVDEISRKVQAIPGARIFAVNPPGLGQRGFRQPVQLVIGGSSYEEVADWRDRMMDHMAQDGRFLNINSNYEETKPELSVELNRARAADLGVSVEEIGKTLETLLGSRNVTTFSERGQEYNVVLQASPVNRASPRDLSNIFVRSQTSQKLIPLSNLITLRDTAGPSDLNRVDRMRSVTVAASLSANYTLGEALQNIEQMAAEALPPEARISWQGEAAEFKESSTSLYFTFGLALLVVFLVLAAQFESFIHPFIIMLTVPLAVAGALGAIWIAGGTINVYSQIGMIMLVGLVAKNGILIVEFANQLRVAGKTIRDAVRDASVARFRPIVMTSITTAFGAVPLAWATGAGAESRAAIGVVVIGGVIFSAVLTLFIVPCVYLLLARFTKPSSYVSDMLTKLEDKETADRAAGGATPAKHPAAAE
jgi:multidrug efflux pump